MHNGRTGRADRRGFSFVELLVVLVILGILAATGLAWSGWFGKRTECNLNRRNVAHQAYLLAIHEEIADGDIPASRLVDAGFLTERQGRCPFAPRASARAGSADAGDYTATVTNGHVTAVECRHTEDHHSAVESLKNLGRFGTAP